MKKILLLSLLATSGLSVKAQSNIDSLYKVWINESQPDSLRVDAYFFYIWDGFLFNKTDSAYILAGELHKYATDHEYQKADAYGFILKAISQLLRANYSEALLNANKSLEIAREINDLQGISRVLNTIGSIYLRLNQLSKALDCFTECLEISEQLGDQIGIAAALGNIGSIYNEDEQHDKALGYISRSLALNEQLGNQSQIATQKSNMALAYHGLRKYAEASDYYTQGAEIYEQLGDSSALSISLFNLGALQLEQKNYVENLDYVNQALEIQRRIGDLNGASASLASIGRTHTELGEHSKAIEYCKEALDLALETEALDQQLVACQCLYDAHKDLGRSDEALVYLERVNQIEKVLHEQETSNKLQQMEFTKQVLADSIAVAEKHRLVEEAHREEVREKNQTRNLLAGAGFILLLLAGGFYSRWRYVRKAKTVIEKEKDRSENLLLNILPADIAAELKEKGRADARDFELVSILFTDFKGFTQASAKLSAQDLVSEINTCFEAFDGIMGKYNIEKIKTIGDAYMAAGGLPIPTEDSVKNTVLAGLEMQDFISKRKSELDAQGKPCFEMRVGIHTGPVVAGIVGVKKFQYDIWGDTVNTASRMESSGEVGKVNISGSTYELLKDNPQFSFERRGKVEAKGKGEIEMYFVSNT